jgi:hypothetical protein
MGLLELRELWRLRDENARLERLGTMVLTLAMSRIGKIAEALDLLASDLTRDLGPLERLGPSFSHVARCDRADGRCVAVR